MYYNEGGLGICTISLPVRPLSHCVFFLLFISVMLIIQARTE